jgi:hypothetical protein
LIQTIFGNFKHANNPGCDLGYAKTARVSIRQEYLNSFRTY